MRKVLSPNSRPTTFNTLYVYVCIHIFKATCQAPELLEKQASGWKENSFLAHFKAHYTTLKALGWWAVNGVECWWGLVLRN